MDIEIKESIHPIGHPRSPYIKIDDGIYFNSNFITWYNAWSELKTYNNFLWHWKQLWFYDKFVWLFDEAECLDVPQWYYTQFTCVTNSSIIYKNTSYPRNNMTEDEIIEFVKTLPHSKE